MERRVPALQVPPQAIVEVKSEPSTEMLVENGPAFASLLRMALLSGTEMTLPTAVQLVMDISSSVVACDGRLLAFAPEHDPASHLLLSSGLDSGAISADNLLHLWAGQAGKPVLAKHGMESSMDRHLETMRSASALAVPLFLQHGWAGSIQMYRAGGGVFYEREAQLLWMLSLLAENQMAVIESIRHLTRMASTDFLTGLRARGYFERALEQEVHRSLRHASPCGLLLMDLDDFKSVNDRFGHHAGDAVLREFAQLLPHGMRDVDTVARFGGDEFALILPDTGTEGMLLIIQRVQAAVAKHRFDVPAAGIALQLGLSVGYALCPANGRNPEELLRAADAALYQSKQQRQPLWQHLRQAG